MNKVDRETNICKLSKSSRRLGFSKTSITDLIIGKKLGSLLGNSFRKTSGIFLSPEKFSGEKKELLARMREIAYNSDIPVKYHEFKLQSTDGSIIDSIKISPPNPGTNPLYVINMFGGCDAFEQNLDMMARNSARQGVIHIGFNYPGMANSTGTLDSATTALSACVSEVLHLVDKGVNPDRIVLSGHSYGAVFADIAAAHLKTKGIKVNAFDRSSFGIASEAAAAIVLEEPGNYSPDGNSHEFGSLKKNLIACALKNVATICNWEMFANNAYNSLDDNKRHYIGIWPNKQERKIIAGDAMVRPRVSMTFLQRAHRREIKFLIRKTIEMSQSNYFHVNMWNNLNNIHDNLTKISTKFCGTLESNGILNKVITNFESNIAPALNQLYDEQAKTGDNTESTQNILTQLDENVKDFNKDLSTLLNLVKYERKFTANFPKFISDCNNRQIMLQRYYERCDRFVLDRNADIASNLEEIGKWTDKVKNEPLFAEWLKLGLLEEYSHMKPDEKAAKIINIVNKMDIHAVPLEYLIQRSEKTGTRLDGAAYYDNYIKMKKEASQNKIDISHLRSNSASVNKPRFSIQNLYKEGTDLLHYI